MKSVLRARVSEVGQPELPAIDVADGAVIGSGATAQIRLPARAVAAAAVKIEDGRWTALAEVAVDGAAKRPGESGDVGDGTTFESGGYAVRVERAPAGAPPSPPQRTESLARELVRSMLGGAAPSLVITRGPGVGARRQLPPPEASVIIGRGDDATWPIADEDLSRAHAELRRDWNGVTLRDLDSKNGTRLDGVRIREPMPLVDGALIAIGNVTLRYDDAAERHLRGSGPRPVIAAPVRASRAPLVVALIVGALAAAVLAWLLLA